MSHENEKISVNGSPCVTLFGILHLQVCVPNTWSDEQVEEFANAESPTGLPCRWTIKRQPEYDVELAQGRIKESGAHERSACTDRAGFCHLLLRC